MRQWVAVTFQRVVQPRRIITTHTDRNVVRFAYDDYWSCPVRESNRRNDTVVLEPFEFFIYLGERSVRHGSLRAIGRTCIRLQVQLHLRFSAPTQRASENLREVLLELTHVFIGLLVGTLVYDVDQAADRHRPQIE